MSRATQARGPSTSTRSLCRSRSRCAETLLERKLVFSFSLQELLKKMTAETEKRQRYKRVRRAKEDVVEASFDERTVLHSE